MAIIKFIARDGKTAKASRIVLSLTLKITSSSDKNTSRSSVAIMCTLYFALIG